MPDTPDETGILSRLDKLLRGRESTSSDDDDIDLGPSRVPVERLRREIDKRRALEGQLTELRQQVEALGAGHKTALDGIKAETAGQLKAIGQAHAEDLALVDLGLSDPIGRKTLREVYGAIPQESRPKSPVDFWRSQVEAQRAHLADPKQATAPEVHRTMTPYLPAAPAAAAQQRPPAAPPSIPGAPAGPMDLSAIPLDQGMDAFLTGLRGLANPGA